MKANAAMKIETALAKGLRLNGPVDDKVPLENYKLINFAANTCKPNAK